MKVVFTFAKTTENDVFHFPDTNTLEELCVFLFSGPFLTQLIPNSPPNRITPLLKRHHIHMKPNPKR